MEDFKKRAITILMNIAEVASLILPVVAVVYLIVVCVKGGTVIHVLIGILRAIFLLACGIALFILTLRIEKMNGMGFKEMAEKLANNKNSKGSSGIPQEMMDAMNQGNMMGGNIPPEMMDQFPVEDVTETVENPVHVEDVQDE